MTEAVHSPESGMSEYKIVERRWVWVPMPEKRYYGRATIRRDARGIHLSEIEMVDPIPNRLLDECYGELANAKTVVQAVRMFARGMIEDRTRYVSKDWRPSREKLQKLWRGRVQRRKGMR
jgi:hypothetical protein